MRDETHKLLESLCMSRITPDQESSLDAWLDARLADPKVLDRIAAQLRACRYRGDSVQKPLIVYRQDAALDP